MSPHGSVESSETAIVCIERIGGFILAQDHSFHVFPEYLKCRRALKTAADYHQVVSELASAAGQLADTSDKDVERRGNLVATIMRCVDKLQNVGKPL